MTGKRQTPARVGHLILEGCWLAQYVTRDCEGIGQDMGIACVKWAASTKNSSALDLTLLKSNCVGLHQTATSSNFSKATALGLFCMRVFSACTFLWLQYAAMWFWVPRI